MVCRTGKHSVVECCHQLNLYKCYRPGTKLCSANARGSNHEPSTDTVKRKKVTHTVLSNLHEPVSIM